MTDNRPVILHISNDYPDPMLPNKTAAIINLIEGTPQYRHVVYSLNRVSALSGINAFEFSQDRIAVAYGALPKGILWEKRLPEIARWIAQDLKKREVTPDLIEAHKFTVEGVIAQDLAKVFACPYICDIQGGTDFRVLQKKKSLRARYCDIARECAAILPYAPWPLEKFKELVGLDMSKCTNLPVIPYVDALTPAPIIGEDKLLSVFHLDEWDRKNFEGMALAVKKLREQGRPVMLDIYGRGRPENFLRLRNFINKHGLGELVHIKGPVAGAQKMQETMKQYAGFVLPSKTESYGLVYVEALFSGVPILLNTNRGIAGYYALSHIGYGCDDVHSPENIARGMAHLLDHEKELKESVAALQKNGSFNQLRKGEILKTYRGVIDNVLKAHSA